MKKGFRTASVLFEDCLGRDLVFNGIKERRNDCWRWNLFVPSYIMSYAVSNFLSTIVNGKARD